MRGRKIILTEQTKKFLKKQGADLIGIAPVERFQGAPQGHRPEDILKSASSVVVAGLHVPHALFDGLPETRLLYTSQFYVVNGLLNAMAYRLSRFLEDKGFQSFPIPARGYANKNLFGIMSHRHAAVAAGLGEFALNNLVITSQYGLRVRFVSIITDAPLEPDEVISLNLCTNSRHICGMACIKDCPVEAFSPEGNLDKSRCHHYQKEIMGKEMHGSELMCGMCIRGCPVGRPRWLPPIKFL